jgi:hypothetical protein
MVRSPRVDPIIAKNSEKYEALVCIFSTLLYSEINSDLSIHVNGQIIPAHKLLLCMKSEVFTAMFNSSMSEAISSKLEINDFSAETVKHLLYYIYLDNTDEPRTMNEACQMLLIGDKYQIKNLEEDITLYIRVRVRCSESFHELKEAMVIGKARNCQSILEDAMDRMLLIFPVVRVFADDPDDDINSQQQVMLTDIIHYFMISN